MRKNSWLIWIIVLIIAAIIIPRLLGGAIEKLFERTRDMYDFSDIYGHVSEINIDDYRHAADDYLSEINFNDKEVFL